MMSDKQWKRYWAGLSIWGKIFHGFKVVAALLAVAAMFIAFAYLVLIVFGLQGFIMHIRDTILLDIMRAIFG